MPKRTDEKFRKAYRFFLKKEEAKSKFTLSEIKDEIGWASSTIKTYLSKKLDGFLSKSGKTFTVSGISKYTEDAFVRYMSQAQKYYDEPLKPPLDSEVEGLVLKAKESSLLALDIYNRPTAIFKSEGFIVLIIIAWTSLLHAIFQKNKKCYFHTEEDGSPKMVDNEEKAWELSKCLKEYYLSDNNPIRKNLEFLIGLRNKIEHRYVPTIDIEVAGECQSAVLNFDELITKEFTEYYSLKDYLSIPLQTANIRTDKFLEAKRKFQGKQYREIKDYIDVYRQGLSEDIFDDIKYSFKVYLIPKIANHLNSSELSIEFIKYDPNNRKEMEKLSKNVALIKEKKVPVVNPGQLTPKKVVEAVKAQTGKKFTIHNHTQAWRYYKVRPREKKAAGCIEKYCNFDDAHSDFVYTKKWVEYLAKNVSDEQEYGKILSTRLR